MNEVKPNIQDPTKEDMIEYLTKECSIYNSGSDQEFRDEIEIAIKYFGDHYHGGQWSNLYSASSTSYFSPGMSGGIEDESTAKDLYICLVHKFADGYFGDNCENCLYDQDDCQCEEDS